MTTEEKEHEIWANIKCYDEYSVSNKGRVKRHPYYKLVRGGGKQFFEEKILRPQKRKFGYLGVFLSKNGRCKPFLIHRLVAIAFIPNPNNLPQVNHKDENPSNNHVSNLEWCDQKYNSNYGTCPKRISEKLRNGKLSIPVKQYTLDGTFIRGYPSAIEASRNTNIAVSGITSCCNKKYTHSGGFIWRYKNDNINISPHKNIILQIKDEKIINEFTNITLASKQTGISRTSISNNLGGRSMSAGGFVWKYKNRQNG